MTQGKFFQLENVNGMQAHFLDYGATVAAIKVPAKDNQLVTVTLGFDTVAEYAAHPFYFGCTVGRVANRIAGGKFTYGAKTFQLACNENNFCHLHGGKRGFDKVVWDAQQKQNRLEFTYFSPAGEEGYPGNLAIKTTYTLTDQNELKINYHATTDEATPINLTNHTYWNLAGGSTILDHTLEIFADEYLEADARHLPTGRILPVANSALDFRRAARIGARLADVKGYDHCYVVSSPRIARVSDPVSGRALETYTTQPGVQFYSGNFLREYPIAAGQRTRQWGGFCLETQGFVDAVNQAQFPSVILQPGEVYQQETVYQLFF